MAATELSSLAAAQGWLMAFLLLLARLATLGVLLRSAFWVSIPWRWWLSFTTVMAAMLACHHHAAMADHVASMSAPQVGMATFRELLIGLALGFGFALLLAGLQIAASVVSQQSGLRWDGAAFDGAWGETVVQRYYAATALAVFWASGGHRRMIDTLLSSLDAVPLGALPDRNTFTSGPAVDLLSTLLHQAFSLGIRVAAPVVFCLLASTILMAMLARTLPFLGAYGVTVAVNLMLVLIVSLAALTPVQRAYRQYWDAASSTIATSYDDWHRDAPLRLPNQSPVSRPASQFEAPQVSSSLTVEVNDGWDSSPWERDPADVAQN